MNKKWIAMILVVAMLLVSVVGCSSKEATPATESEETTVEQAQAETAAQVEEPAEKAAEEPAPQEVSEEPEAAAEAEASDVPEENVITGYRDVDTTGLNSAERALIFEEAFADSVQLPLAENETITLWAGLDPRTADIVAVSTPEDVYYLYGHVQEATGVSFQITGVSAMVQSEKFDLMIAGGDYCDIIYQVGNLYNGGLRQALTDEVIVDISSLLEEEAPIAYNTMMSYDEVRFQYIFDDGTMGAVPLLYKEAGTEVGGNVIRADWKEEAGIQGEITTIDQLYEYMTAAYQNHGGQLASGNQSLDMKFLTTAMGWSADLYQDDATHTVKYGWLEDGGYDFIETCRQWYSEGLMYEDFYSLDTSEFQKDFGTGACSMVEVNGPSGISELYNWAPGGKDSLEIEAIGTLVLHEGDEITYSQANSIIKEESWAWSCDNEHPELCMQLVNWLYTENGQLVYNYGKEGVTFNYDDEGGKVYTDLILNNADGWTETQALILCTNGSMPSIHDMAKTYYDFDEIQWNAMELFKGDNIDRNVIPSAATSAMTTEQSETIANIQTDMETYMEETIYKWVCGTTDFNEELYKEFQDTIIGMDVQTIIDINQQLLDDYYATIG